MAGNFYGFSAQALDLSYIGQAGAAVANTVQQLPATMEAQNKRDLLKAQVEQLKLDLPKAEEIRKAGRDQAIERYQTELGLSDEEMTDRIKAGIEARYYSPVMGDEKTDPSKAVLRWSDADTKLEVAIKAEKEKRDKTRGAAAAQQVATQPTRVSDSAADLSIGPPEQIAKPAPQYQEDALAAYGDLSASGGAPVQETKDLLQQPGIAALPKRPEPDKPLTEYQKWEMKFKEDEVKAKKIEDAHKTNASDAKDRDANVKWALTTETDYLAGSKTALEKASRLKQAIIKLKAGKVLDINDTAGLTDGPTDLETLQQEYENANDMVARSKEAARKFGAIAKAVAKGSSIADASGQYDTAATNSAVSVVKDQATQAANTPPVFNSTPGVLKSPVVAAMEAAGKKYDTSLQMILNRLPSETRLIIERKVDEARAQGLSDQDIATRLLAAGK
jgi:hypothetical protein